MAKATILSKLEASVNSTKEIYRLKDGKSLPLDKYPIGTTVRISSMGILRLPNGFIYRVEKVSPSPSVEEPEKSIWERLKDLF